MNADKLKEWSESSPEAAAMYAYLASRKRGTRGGKPSDLKHIVGRLLELGFTLSPKQVEIELEKLQAMGVGQLERKANRRPKWKWTDSPAVLAKVINGGISPIMRIVEPPLVTSNGPGTIKQRHIIRILRGDIAIEASPEDLISVLEAIGNR